MNSEKWKYTELKVKGEGLICISLRILFNPLGNDYVFFEISETAVSTAEQQTRLQAHAAGQLCVSSQRHKAGEGLKPWAFLFVQIHTYTHVMYIPIYLYSFCSSWGNAI